MSQLRIGRIGLVVLLGVFASLATLTSALVASAQPTGSASITGYWEAASDGGVFSFGNAQFYGSMGGQPLNRPIVGTVATPDGKGYWLFASDGGVFAFGDAPYLGSTSGLPLNVPIVGMAATPSGVNSDGATYQFGDSSYVGAPSGGR
jgi:hypothetical protein